MNSCTFVCAMSNSNNIVRISISYYNSPIKEHIWNIQVSDSKSTYQHSTFTTPQKVFSIKSHTSFYLLLQVRLLWHLLLHILLALKHLHLLVWHCFYHLHNHIKKTLTALCCCFHSLAKCTVIFIERAKQTSITKVVSISAN